MKEKTFEILQTKDGSFTLKHPTFDEAYHSVSAGAVTESAEKFLKPSGVLEIVEQTGKVRILEVGFGLGINCAVTLFEITRRFPSSEVEYISLDAELNQLKVPVAPPGELGVFYRTLRDEILNRGVFQRGKVVCRLITGDARKTVKNLEGSFDAVYHDPFSPRKNCELWTLEFLNEIFKRLNPSGFWVTYSAALPVRRALYELGLKIFNTRPVGRRSPGTAATFGGEPLSDYLYPLLEKDLRRIKNSPRAVPFRDPTLSAPREEICRRYEEEVQLREEQR